MSDRDVQHDLGRHPVTVESVDWADKAGDMTDIQFDVYVRFDDDGERNFKTYYPCRDGKNPEMARGVLRAMGWDLDKEGIEPLMADNKKLAGAKLQATVSENVWNGKTSNQIAFLNPIPKKPTSQGIKRVNEILRLAKNSNASEEL